MLAEKAPLYYWHSDAADRGLTSEDVSYTIRAMVSPRPPAASPKV